MSAKKSSTPLVGVPCDVKLFAELPFHAVGEKYITALLRNAGVFPILLPVRAESLDIERILSICDGVFFPGSPSNVHPENYDGAPPRPEVELDLQRDAYTLPLLKACMEKAVPLFCVCRGFQELNVAGGGTLHQHLEETPAPEGYAERIDHREDKNADLEKRYGLAHEVELVAGGFLESLLAKEAPTGHFPVNSLHGQGVALPAPGARVEAIAKDGAIEALHFPDAPAFTLGVQWHPEWKCEENPVSLRLFEAFGQAVFEATQRRTT